MRALPSPRLRCFDPPVNQSTKLHAFVFCPSPPFSDDYCLLLLVTATGTTPTTCGLARLDARLHCDIPASWIHRPTTIMSKITSVPDAWDDDYEATADVRAGLVIAMRASLRMNARQRRHLLPLEAQPPSNREAPERSEKHCTKKPTSNCGSLQTIQRPSTMLKRGLPAWH